MRMTEQFVALGQRLPFRGLPQRTTIPWAVLDGPHSGNDDNGDDRPGCGIPRRAVPCGDERGASVRRHPRRPV